MLLYLPGPDHSEILSGLYQHRRVKTYIINFIGILLERYRVSNTLSYSISVVSLTILVQAVTELDNKTTHR